MTERELTDWIMANSTRRKYAAEIYLAWRNGRDIGSIVVSVARKSRSKRDYQQRVSGKVVSRIVGNATTDELDSIATMREPTICADDFDTLAERMRIPAQLVLSLLWEGYTQREITTKTGISEGQVSKLVTTIRENFSGML